MFARGGRDPRLWNLEYNSGNPESNQRLESRIQVPLTLESSIWNPKSKAWNPEFAYLGQNETCKIFLHYVILYYKCTLKLSPPIYQFFSV